MVWTLTEKIAKEARRFSDFARSWLLILFRLFLFVSSIMARRSDFFSLFFLRSWEKGSKGKRAFFFRGVGYIAFFGEALPQ